jgi:energy-coupling factor transporter ATP-binding protein EcfA2
MKLLRLYVGDYRVLRDLDISFGSDDEQEAASDYSIDFVVGVNGTGKSTVLRALAYLVGQLERFPAPISFIFELEYELGRDNGKRKVKISNRPEDLEEETPSEVRAWVDGELRSSFSDELLPPRVVAFTTGSETEWEFDESCPEPIREESASPGSLSLEELSIRELPGKPLKAESNERVPTKSRFILLRQEELPLVTLCGTLVNMAEAERSQDRKLSRVFREAKIGRLSGFSLKFRMSEGTTTPQDRETVERIAKQATRRLRMGTDHLAVFDLTKHEQTLSRALIREFSNGMQLFEELGRLGRATDGETAMLREVNLFFERPLSKRAKQEGVETPPMHLLNWLSDGEQSFLGRMCLFPLLGETEALIMLDEPEVHFNDYWKRQIVSLLDKSLEGKYSHVLIATHSSITLSDVARDDIVVLDRGINHTSLSSKPRIETLATDPSDIMVHVFGAPNPAGELGIERIRSALEKIPGEGRKARQARLKDLLEKVGPGYWSYSIRQELSEEAD